MKLTLIVTSHPYTQQSSLTAYHFCQAALMRGHLIQTLFFNADGAYHANSLAIPTTDELDLTASWATLAKQHNFPLQVCSTAAIHRGILSVEQAQFYEKPASHWHPAFIISGLGQLYTAIAASDRVLEF